MKNILIIQNELPIYRDFLWQGIRKSFNLYLAEARTNRLFLPDGTLKTFQDYEFRDKLDCLVINGGIREAIKSVLYIKKYRAKSVLGWTQFVGRNKSLLSRFVKSVYLMTLFDSVLLYYEHEKQLIPFESLKQKATGLNNTIADWNYSPILSLKKNSFLYLGRYTEKSKLSLFLEAALDMIDIEVHFIGVDINVVPKKFRKSNFHFHGMINDLDKIQALAAGCTYFVYPGDVGLSIVHAVKLGLIPVVHAKLDSHMPECQAVAEKFPIFYFQKDDLSSLSNVLQLLVGTEGSKKTKEWIASRARKVFSQESMISNFSNALNRV